MNSIIKKILLISCLSILGIGCSVAVRNIRRLSTTSTPHIEIPTSEALEGTNWQLQSINNQKSNRGGLSFGGKSRLSAYFCNSTNGRYSLENGHLNAYNLWGSLILCGTGKPEQSHDYDIMTVEGIFTQLASSSTLQLSYDFFKRRTLHLTDGKTTLVFSELKKTPRPTATEHEKQAAVEQAVQHVANLNNVPLYEPRFFTDRSYRSKILNKVFVSYLSQNYENYPYKTPGRLSPTTTLEFKPSSVTLTFEDGYEIPGTIVERAQNGEVVRTYAATSTGKDIALEGLPLISYRTTTYTEPGLFSLDLPYTHFLKLVEPNNIKYWESHYLGSLYINPDNAIGFGNYDGVYSSLVRAFFAISFMKNSSPAGCTSFNDIPSSATFTRANLLLNNEQFSVAHLIDKNPDSETQIKIYRTLKHDTCFEFTTSLRTIPQFVEKNYDDMANKKREFEKYLNEVAHSFKVF